VREGAGGCGRVRGRQPEALPFVRFFAYRNSVCPRAVVSDSTTRRSEPLNKGITLITPEISIG